MAYIGKRNSRAAAPANPQIEGVADRVEVRNADLRADGMQDVGRSGLSFWVYAPVRTVTGHKTPA